MPWFNSTLQLFIDFHCSYSFTSCFGLLHTLMSSVVSNIVDIYNHIHMCEHVKLNIDAFGFITWNHRNIYTRKFDNCKPKYKNKSIYHSSILSIYICVTVT